MAFKQPDDKSKSPAPPPKPIPLVSDKSGKPPAAKKPPERLVSLDTYRGFTMLFLASSGLAIQRLVGSPHGVNAPPNDSEFINRFHDTAFAKPWMNTWQFISGQLDHVTWTGCTAWDLIQPSFMFMVGVAMPFSYAARAARGDSWGKQFTHALVRALILILMGIFLRSVHSSMTHFTFEDVLTQIGLGYLVVFLLLRAPFIAQLVAALVILGGYWYYFFQYPLPPAGGDQVTRYVTEHLHEPASEFNQFTGLAAHWNKHTNAAAHFDRIFLNFFPSPKEPWEGKKFWVNGGGYQTLNFVPSIVTMLFGVMAGQLLRGSWPAGRKLQALLAAAAICFIASMAVDTTIWPDKIRELSHLSYSYAPIVKRLWTPSWAVFSSGWTFLFLALFYWFVDMLGFRKLALPLAIVGMNSIAVYWIYELLEGWLAAMFKIHLKTFDVLAHTSLVERLYGGTAAGAVWRQCAVLILIWLICLAMYRRRIFIRV